MTTLDPERQKQAKQYARIRRRLWLVDNAFSAIYAFAWLFLGWAISLREWLNGFTANEWFLVPAFVDLRRDLFSRQSSSQLLQRIYPSASL